MVFSSLLFVFAFLSISMGIYLCVPKRYQNTVLLVSSLIFYSWGGPMYLLLLLGETAISWVCALRIGNLKSKKKKKFWMTVECVALLGLLAIFKYTGFIGSTMQALTGFPEHVAQIVLPIGISFYTFQLLSYVIDVYRGEVKAQRNYARLLLYSSLFHQCIAGPIVRYKTVADEIEHRSVTMNDVYAGIRRFSIGLAKKAILANGIAQVADQLMSTNAQTLEENGYLAIWTILNAADFGVPQKRERLILMAVKKELADQIELPEPTHHSSEPDLSNSAGRIRGFTRFPHFREPRSGDDSLPHGTQ